MRKWMSERLKRRKKSADENSGEASKRPEPLQPKYYEDDPTPAQDAAVADSVTVQKAEITPNLAENGATENDSASSVPAVAGTAATGRPRSSTRRRRGRGGRGNARSRTVPTAPGEVPSEAALPAELPPTASPAAGTIPDGPAVAVRPNKGTVVLAIGLPGSGKSSWFKRHEIHPLSSDLLRELLFDDAQEQRFQDLVFSNLRSMLKARLIARRPLNYVDATNLTPHDRHSWIKLAKDYGYDVQGLYFDVPVEVCMERHQKRGRVVPEDIMRKMAGKLKAPTFEEGFSKITVVRVKQKEAAAQ